MTTTLRPSEPLQHSADGGRSRAYDICVNGRIVGSAHVSTDPGFGPATGVIGRLRVDEPDRGRGRGTVAALASEEVLRDWGCRQVLVRVPTTVEPALRMARSLGYAERSRNMVKELPERPAALPPGLEVRPMTEAEFGPWEAEAREKYARSWTERGMPADQARAKAEAGHRELLPDGPATPGMAFHLAVRDGQVVGRVWTGFRDLEPGTRGGYVYDIEVVEEHRGHGYGRALMLLAEQTVRAAGESLIGLHVFTGNAPAIRLYESLDYRTTHLNSFKAL